MFPGQPYNHACMIISPCIISSPVVAIAIETHCNFSVMQRKDGVGMVCHRLAVHHINIMGLAIIQQVYSKTNTEQPASFNCKLYTQ